VDERRDEVVVQFGFVIPSAARDLGVPIRAGARKARILIQTAPLPGTTKGVGIIPRSHGKKNDGAPGRRHDLGAKLSSGIFVP